MKKMTMTAITDRQASDTLTEDAQLLASLVFPFNPVPASRPRVTRWGTYYSKTYKAWKEAAERSLQPGTLHLGADIPLIVIVRVIARRPKSTKLTTPRGDLDNYVKAPLDVITKVGGYWKDDTQVVSIISWKRFAEEDEQPRTEVDICR